MSLILTAIQFYSLIYAMDPSVACGIISAESGFDPTSVGQHGEVGLFQLMPDVVRVSQKDLKDPIKNIQAGFEFIQTIKKECRHKDGLDWLVCYNLGSPKGNHVKHPKLFKYYKTVLKEKEKCSKFFRTN